MKTDNFVSTITYLGKRLGGAGIVILAVTGLLCWLLGWRNLADYSTVLKWAGLIVVCLPDCSAFWEEHLLVLT